MKIDMHCHTKEGSIDAKVPVEKYIRKLISKGFDGMLVTDHNSYKGYLKFKDIVDKLRLDKNFVVLKGIEYDTRDGGHMIVILPDHIKDAFMQIRGLTVSQLEKIVHRLGGILGPAHPFGTGYFAYANTKFGKKHPEFVKKFDFIEALNAGTKEMANIRANLFAQMHKLPMITGSDAHKEKNAGYAYTVFKDRIRSNNDLISAIKTHRKYISRGMTGNHENLRKNIMIEGTITEEMKMKKNAVIVKLGVIGYWVYNKAGALFNHSRIKRLILLHNMHNCGIINKV